MLQTGTINQFITFIRKGGKVTKCPPRIAKGADCKQLDMRTFRKRCKEHSNSL